MSFREATVLVLFVSLVLLWFFRKPGFFTSYGDLLGLDKDGNPSIEDATPAILICILLFVLPGRLSFYEKSWVRTDNVWWGQCFKTNQLQSRNIALIWQLCQTSPPLLLANFKQISNVEIVVGFQIVFIHPLVRVHFKIENHTQLLECRYR